MRTLTATFSPNSISAATRIRGLFVLVVVGLLAGHGSVLARDVIHEVRGTESLDDIAAQYYGNARLGESLRLHNELASSDLSGVDSLRVPHATRHTVKSGDTWSSLAETHWGDANLAGNLWRLVGGSPRLDAGRVLEIPALIPVRLKSGETLASFSRLAYGRADRAVELARLNQVDDPRSLRPGTVVQIPILTFAPAGAETLAVEPQMAEPQMAEPEMAPETQQRAALQVPLPPVGAAEPLQEEPIAERAAEPVLQQPAQVAAPIRAQAPLRANQLSGPSYEITAFDLDYLQQVADAPAANALGATTIVLEQLDEVYVAAGQGGLTVSFRLDSVPADGPRWFHASAVISINQQIVAELARNGLGAMIVAASEEDIEFTTGVDLRPAGRTDLSLTIFLPTVRELQTFASGDRIAEEDAANHSSHARILANSPVQSGDAFRPREVDEYVARLNRHPGRRVEAQLSPSRDPSQLYLDYQITESRPWLIYGQYMNTGTESTQEWQQRLGLVNFQVFERDDVFTFDFVTDLSSDVQALYASYTLPLLSDRMRVRFDGSWSEFQADANLGFEQLFEGQQSKAGVQFELNVFQYRQLFIDVVAGVNYQVIEADNKTALIRGKDSFVMPHVGLGVARDTGASRFNGSIWIDWNRKHLSHNDFDEVAALGRLNPDLDFQILRWASSLSFFLDPLLKQPTQAHEVSVEYRGQDAFNRFRLIPHHQQIAGGMETVRGYKQGVTAGDSVHLASFEYRFHVPRLLSPSPQATELPLLGEVAIAPRETGGRPDWDLVFKLFYDVARLKQSHKTASEFDERLRGVGAGIEFVYKRWMAVAFDWGVGLDDARGGEIKAHRGEGHLSVSLFY
jgi:hemolysin activation/secretion protein